MLQHSGLGLASCNTVSGLANCNTEACTEDEKHSETEVIKQCLLADRVARRSRSSIAVSAMYLQMYVSVICQNKF